MDPFFDIKRRGKEAPEQIGGPPHPQLTTHEKEVNDPIGASAARDSVFNCPGAKRRVALPAETPPLYLLKN